MYCYLPELENTGIVGEGESSVNAIRFSVALHEIPELRGIWFYQETLPVEVLLEVESVAQVFSVVCPHLNEEPTDLIIT